MIVPTSAKVGSAGISLKEAELERVRLFFCANRRGFGVFCDVFADIGPARWAEHSSWKTVQSLRQFRKSRHTEFGTVNNFAASTEFYVQLLIGFEGKIECGRMIV